MSPEKIRQVASWLTGKDYNPKGAPRKADNLESYPLGEKKVTPPDASMFETVRKK